MANSHLNWQVGTAIVGFLLPTARPHSTVAHVERPPTARQFTAGNGPPRRGAAGRRPLEGSIAADDETRRPGSARGRSGAKVINTGAPR